MSFFSTFHLICYICFISISKGCNRYNQKQRIIYFKKNRKEKKRSWFVLIMHQFSSIALMNLRERYCYVKVRVLLTILCLCEGHCRKKNHKQHSHDDADTRTVQPEMSGMQEDGEDTNTHTLYTFPSCSFPAVDGH